MPPQVVHDRQRGLLVFLRVYSGQLHAKDLLYNSTRDHKQRPLQLLGASVGLPANLLLAGRPACMAGGGVVPRPSRPAPRRLMQLRPSDVLFGL